MGTLSIKIAPVSAFSNIKSQLLYIIYKDNAYLKTFQISKQLFYIKKRKQLASALIYNILYNIISVSYLSCHKIFSNLHLISIKKSTIFISLSFIVLYNYVNLFNLIR